MRKPLKSLGRPVAGGLLLGSVVMSGCLFPQYDDPAPEVPTFFKNHRPQIIGGQVKPDQSPFVSIQAGPGCMMTPFSVVVSDEDTGDTLRAAWRASTINGQTRTPWLDGDLINVGSTTVQRPLPFAAPDTLYAESLLIMTGDIRIDVVVSDQPFNHTFVNNVEVLQEEQFTFHIDDGGIQTEAAGTDSYTWTGVVSTVNCQ